jgi:MFS family permease
MPFRKRYETAVEDSPHPEIRFIRYRKLRNAIRELSTLEPTAAPPPAVKLARRLAHDVEAADLFALTLAGRAADKVREANDHAVELAGLLTDKRISKLHPQDLMRVRWLQDEFLAAGAEIAAVLSYLDWNVRAVNKLTKQLTSKARGAAALSPMLSEYVRRVVNIADIPNPGLSPSSSLTVAMATPPASSDETAALSAFRHRTSLRLEQAARAVAHLPPSGDDDDDGDEEETDTDADWHEAAGRAVALHAANLHLSSLVSRSHYPQAIAGLIATIAARLDRLAVAEEFLVGRDYALATGEAAEASMADDAETAVCAGRERAAELLRSLVLAKSKLEGRARTPFQTAVAAQAGIFLQSDDEEEENGDTENAKDEEQQRLLTIPEVNFTLNAASAFLYMLSYTAILPTAGTYAEKLGSSKAASGVLIGGAPLAGIVSSVLFSYLSNFGYKQPLLLSSYLCMLGNLMYSLAWTFRSLPLAIAGRLVVGFGGARAVNRRFIADCSARSTLVARSADFVTASAVGMAAGPALSALLTATLPNFSLGVVMFDDATNPGWTCAFVWAGFIAAMELWFKEPGRPAPSAAPAFLIASAPISISGNGSPEAALLGQQLASVSYGAATTRVVTAGPTGAPFRARSQWLDLLQNKPVLFCLFVYFTIKVVCDLFVSAAPLILAYHYGWNESSVGVFVAFLGILVFPANYLVGRLARRFEDSTQLVFSLALVAVGCILSVPIITYPPPLAEYMLAAIVVFVSTNVAEAVLMAILARLMPRSLARGTFNSGLLSTEAGMIGRTCGNFGVTIAASGPEGMDWILWRAFIPCLILASLVLRVTWVMQNKLRDHSDKGSSDDSDDEDAKAEREQRDEETRHYKYATP